MIKMQFYYAGFIISRCHPVLPKIAFQTSFLRIANYRVFLSLYSFTSRVHTIRHAEVGVRGVALWVCLRVCLQSYGCDWR